MIGPSDSMGASEKGLASRAMFRTRPCGSMNMRSKER